jgi:hypothetical protein
MVGWLTVGGETIKRQIGHMMTLNSWVYAHRELYNAYRIKHLALEWVPQGGSNQGGRFSYGHLTDIADAFRGPVAISDNTYFPLRTDTGRYIDRDETESLNNAGSVPLNTHWKRTFVTNGPWQRLDGTIKAFISTFAASPPSTTKAMAVVNTAELRQDCPLGGLALYVWAQNGKPLEGTFRIHYSIEFREPAIPALNTQNPVREAVPTRELTVVPIESFSGSAILGVQGDKPFNRRNQALSLISSFRRSPTGFILELDHTRIEERPVTIKLVMETPDFTVTPVNSMLGLPRKEGTTFVAEYVPGTDPSKASGIAVAVKGNWSGNLSWIVCEQFL